MGNGQKFHRIHDAMNYFIKRENCEILESAMKPFNAVFYPDVYQYGPLTSMVSIYGSTLILNYKKLISDSSKNLM